MQPDDLSWQLKRALREGGGYARFEGENPFNSGELKWLKEQGLLTESAPLGDIDIAAVKLTEAGRAWFGLQPERSVLEVIWDWLRSRKD